MKVIFILVFFATVVRAEESRNALNQMIAGDQTVYTKEGIVEIEKRKFRRVEYMRSVYFLELLRSDRSNELSLLCDQQGAKVFNTNSPAMTIPLTVTKRTRAFVDGLKVTCENLRSGNRMSLDKNLAVGFGFNSDDSDIKPFFRGKSVFINPIYGGIGFSSK